VTEKILPLYIAWIHVRNLPKAELYEINFIFNDSTTKTGIIVLFQLSWVWTISPI